MHAEFCLMLKIKPIGPLLLVDTFDCDRHWLSCSLLRKPIHTGKFRDWSLRCLDLAWFN